MDISESIFALNKRLGLHSLHQDSGEFLLNACPASPMRVGITLTLRSSPIHALQQDNDNSLTPRMTPGSLQLFTVRAEREAQCPSPPISRALSQCRHMPAFAGVTLRDCDRLLPVVLIAVVLAVCTCLPAVRAHGQMPTGAAPSQDSTRKLQQEIAVQIRECLLGNDEYLQVLQHLQIPKRILILRRLEATRELLSPFLLTRSFVFCNKIRIFVVELKSQVADRLQQQGTDVDANNITDQMLYDQIETNADLRTNITTFLRARGYVSSNDLSVAGANVSDQSMVGQPLPGEHSLSTSGGSNATRLAAAAGLDSGSSSSDQTGVSTSSIQSMNSAGNTLDSEQRRGREAVNASTDLPKVLRRPTPYNLQSLRDLYTQIPEQSASLKRFGSEVFVNRSMSAMARGGAGRDTPLDVPLGPDYVIGSGDTLTINMWGGMTQSISRVVDRDGRILLPDAGSLDVAGLPLQQAENLIEGALQETVSRRTGDGHRLAPEVGASLRRR